MKRTRQLKLSQSPNHQYLLEEWFDSKKTPDDVTYGSSYKATWRCLKGHTWQSTVNKRTTGRNCPTCYKEQLPEMNRKKGTKITLWDKREEFPHLLQEYHPNNTFPITEIAVSSGLKCRWVCSRCSNAWETTPNKRTSRGDNCPKCRSSKLEEFVRSILQKQEIPYYEQCRYPVNWEGKKRMLTVDFQIEYKDCYFVLECQGIQHYQPVDHFGGEKGFQYTQENDTIKHIFFSNPSLPHLLEFPYTELGNEEYFLQLLEDGYQLVQKKGG